jgi:hypothetical protein
VGRSIAIAAVRVVKEWREYGDGQLDSNGYDQYAVVESICGGVLGVNRGRNNN